MFHYSIAGLSVSSEIVLPGLISRPESGAAAAVKIHRSDVPAHLGGATEVRATFEISGNAFLLAIPGVARFLLRDGNDIAFQIEDGADDGDVAIFVIGTVFGILLHQRDQVVLHASAVRVNDHAVLFCGESGAGKSTLAAALGQRGYAIVSDDLCAITPGHDQIPTVQPDGRQLKLWSQSVEKLELEAKQGAAVRRRLQKFYVEPDEAAAQALPVGAVYILRETKPPLSDGIDRPNVVDAALLIRQNAYRPRLVHAMQQRPQYVRSAAQMISKAGIFILNRPLQFAALPETLSRLEQHWRDLGLMEKAE